MTFEIMNGHQFHLQTKLFQEQAITHAAQKVEELIAQNSKLISKPYVLSRVICKEAYDKFKKEVEKAFPSETYRTLITLTLQARETLFFVDLKERVIEIINKSKPDISSSKMDG